jgi:hypothetical protein
MYVLENSRSCDHEVAVVIESMSGSEIFNLKPPDTVISFPSCPHHAVAELNELI